MINNKALSEICVTTTEECKLKIDSKLKEAFLLKAQNKKDLLKNLVFSDEEVKEYNYNKKINSPNNSYLAASTDIPIIYLEEGTFYEDNFEITFPVIIKGSDTIDSSGNHISKTIVSVETKGPTIVSCHDCENVELRNITFDRNSTSGIAVLFLDQNFKNGIVSQCRVIGTPGEPGTNQFCALEVLNGASNITFEENVVEGFHSGKYAAGIGFIFGRDIIIKNNKIDGLDSTGNGIEGLIYGPGTFEGNDIKNCNCGIYENQANLNITNNKCINNACGATLDHWSITLKNNNFKNNTVSLNSYDGFDATQNYWGTTNPTTLNFENSTPKLAPWFMDESMTTLSTPVSSITVTSSISLMYYGSTLNMTASISPSNPTISGVIWSVECGIKDSASIDENGVLKSNSTADTVTVKATAKDMSGVIGTKTITILSV
ncbi:hypothetical protein Ccar_09730 [Clostridium carboxidivorans P7]|uniref:Parallel beta-helix repeat protein n=1 Tax=Clostridium carboxidivorans P7 TaxID=536227 RepID=C6PPW1_9CLOT|nr:right-handed parallel beta-helix repeat-containing protein [Clostridium carboxidivorans]AKN31117.1 hypothetical protein Ccar_09730 [Clostridium carboxidivorans P7]EET88702.1 Parallel beta-helix repeat protein [Clostridium carboxidivorans P7]EFG88613.1 hypothetical protein CLCAR_1358 [Clostridium carboxidivorans P7]